MRAYIQKWGNSLAIRIPSSLSKELDLRAGTKVNIDLEDDQIILKKIEYDLDEMLSQITSKNLHSPQLEGKAKGNEEW